MHASIFQWTDVLGFRWPPLAIEGVGVPLQQSGLAMDLRTIFFTF